MFYSFWCVVNSVSTFHNVTICWTPLFWWNIISTFYHVLFLMYAVKMTQILLRHTQCVCVCVRAPANGWNIHILFWMVFCFRNLFDLASFFSVFTFYCWKLPMETTNFPWLRWCMPNTSIESILCLLERSPCQFVLIAPNEGKEKTKTNTFQQITTNDEQNSNNLVVSFKSQQIVFKSTLIIGRRLYAPFTWFVAGNIFP